MLYRTPVIDRQTLLVTRPWSEWLAALCTRAGGFGDVASLTEGLAALAALTEDVAGLHSALTALTVRVAALEAAAALHQGLPSVQAVAAGAGTGASASVAGRDQAGTLSLTTQSSQPRRSHSAVLRLTFAAAYTTTPWVLLMPANDAAWALPAATIRLRQADVSTTGFTLRSGVARLPRDGEVYQWNFLVQ